MSSVDITVKNPDTDQDAYYDVTVEFIDSRHNTVAKESAYLGRVPAKETESRSVYVARPANSRGLTVRLLKVEREVAPAKQSPTALDRAMGMLVSKGLVPAGTPYGDCPDAAPQTWWIGERGNCWAATSAQPTFPTTPALPTPAPAFPGARCADGWVSGSTGRGTCSHHGGVSR
ncbi:hypothetical protein [Streptomyces mirabilis]